MANAGKASFGLGQVAANLVNAQGKLGLDATIWCQDKAEDIAWVCESFGISKKQIRSFPHVGFSRFAYSPAMLSAAKVNRHGFRVVHQHGIWTVCSQVSNIFRSRHQTPVVIAPHGSLQKWALKRSVWKKKLAAFAYETDNLHQAACLHALADTEVIDFREFGLRNPIALIPNGISDRWLNSSGLSDRFIDQFNLPRDRCILLFLSRITPKKGLPMLLRAIYALRSALREWMLVIAGVDEFNHKKEIEDLVTQLQLQNMVRILGPLYDQVKSDAFAAADVFVLPSYSEGSPLVVLESLSAGVPVITTKGTPWKSLITYNCGWWVDASTEGIVEALQHMLELSNSQLKAMGQHGHELVKSQYRWEIQAQKTSELYAWLLGQQGKPEFVITD